ncbi:MAG: S-layer homology domain-containing protein [Clostridia bacterium]|nr:S-layer homology domain-containing protein [Clostridia bacterium]
MKKFIGVFLSMVLVFTLLPIARAEASPAIVSVTAPQIDNMVYFSGGHVRVVCENTEFTKTGVEVDVMYSTVETVYNLEIIDDVTIEFDLKLYQAPVMNYGLRLEIPMDIGAPLSIFKSNCIEVRRGHIDFDINPITADELTNNGLTVKFYNPPEDINGAFQFDGVVVAHSKISDRVFRIYPEREKFAGKTEAEIRFIYEGNYYRKTLYIVDNEIWMDPPVISRSEPVDFYINAMNIEFPADKDDISLVIRGKGRYIDLNDITIVDSKKIHVFTPLPLSAGTYDLNITWPGLGMTYTIPLVITKSTVLSDMALDEAVEDAVYETYYGFDLAVNGNIAEKYLASEKKVIDFSDRPLEKIYLLIENESVNMLANAGKGLDIIFEDCKITIPGDALALGRTKDLYAILDNGKEIEGLDVKFFPPVEGIYIDTNISWFKIEVPEPSNLYSYEGIKAMHYYVETGLINIGAAYESGMFSCEAGPTGVYQFVLEGMSFSDISAGYWGAEYIYPLSSLDIIDGMGDGTFLPEGLVTNAQFTKLVCEAIGLETNSTLSGFADVDMDSWYYPYVCAMESAGIIEGTYFNPDKPMKRLDMAKAVTRAYAYYSGADISALASESEEGFLDIAQLSISDREHIKAAYELGIINGMTATIFAPDGNATRSQAAAMIFRLLQAMGIA